MKCEEGTETENVKSSEQVMAEILAASDRGSYSEQDNLLELDGLHKEEDEVVPEDSESAELCRVYGVKNRYSILFAAVQIHGRLSSWCYTRTSPKF